MTDKEHAFNLAYTMRRLLTRYGDSNPEQRIQLQVNAARALSAYQADQARELI